MIIMSTASESKRLACRLRTQEDSYVSGELDLNETLTETDRLFNEIRRIPEERVTADDMRPDAYLINLQSGLAKKSAKAYKPDSLVFNPTDFSIKLKHFYDQPSAPGSSTFLWKELGNMSKKLLYTVPSFNFIYNTFDPDPIEVVKKKRRIREKDKVGDVTKPISTNLDNSDADSDPMMKEASRVLGIFNRICKKNEDNVVCFYEFVTDPTSFGRTVENIFVLSILVKCGEIRIVQDSNGLPCITQINDKKKKKESSTDTKQSIISISEKEWRDIVRQFNLKKPLIPPRKSTL